MDATEITHFSVEYNCADRLQASILYLPQTRMGMKERLQSSFMISLIWAVAWIGIAWRLVRTNALYLLVVVGIFMLAFLLSFVMDWVRFAVCRFRLWFCSRLGPQWLAQQFKAVTDGSPQFANLLDRWLHIETILQQLESPARYDYWFDEWGGRYETPTMRVGLAWAEFKQVLENEQVLLLVHGKWNYWVIPKRLFADPDQFVALRELAKRHIEKR